MTVPVVTVRIDWDNDGAFTGGYDDVTSKVGADSLTWTRGRSADFSAEATGAASFTLVNTDERFTPDRNWHDNPSFERGTTGWSVAAITGLTVAATSISQVTDNATAATGTKAGEAVLTATVNSGVTYPIPYTFRSGVAYAVSVYLKSTAGNLNVRAGLASAGTPADIASSGANITTSWAAYTFTWTPSADRTDAVFFVRTTTAAAATLRIDGVQVNPGSTANTYIEAPTKGQLIPGRPVHIYATYSATDYALFFGYIERLAPNAWDWTVTITCYDPLRRMAETDVVVPGGVDRSAREFRTAILEDYERGNRNMLVNPHFAADTTYWTTVGGGGTLTRLTTDNCPETTGVTCGQFVSASVSNRIATATALTPVIFAGVTYRATIWLKWVSGATTVVLGLGGDPALGSPVGRFKVVTISGSWTKHTITHTVATQTSASATFDGFIPFSLSLMTTGASTFLLDGAQVTRGQGAYPYSAAGTGRWPNWCANGSFDAGALTGWYDGYTNLVSNPSFETDTSGWSGGSITRVVADPQYGTAHATIAGDSAAVTYTLSGTFKQGVTYRYRLGHKLGTQGYSTVSVYMRSSGTPADTSSSASQSCSTSWQTVSGTWTPAADRTDAVIYITDLGGGTVGNVKIDGAMVVRVGVAPADYSTTGPGGGGSFATTATTASTAKYGSLAQSVVTPATATAGRVYDFNLTAPLFLSGQPYTLSLWLRAADAMPYRVGWGANKGDGTWDEASTTGTLSANTWTQVTVTWTPSAERSAATALHVVAFVYQTDATARTFYVDGVRVIPGSSADDFEMSQWSLALEPDAYLTAASLTGSAQSCLTQINDYALTRHWIAAAMATPWYTYRTAGRSDTKTSAETFDGDMQDMTTAEVDRASIVNLVPISYRNGLEYYSDPASVATYGLRPTGLIGAGYFLPDSTIPEAISAALLARYKVPRARPTMTIVNRFPSQLQRELDDLISVHLSRLRIYGGNYLIAASTTNVRGGGAVWTTNFRLEEQP